MNFGQNGKVDVAGLQIDAITKVDLLQQIQERIKRRQRTIIVTPYSEFLYASLRNPQTRELFNSADFSIADGVGIIWAELFLSQPLTAKGFWGKVVQAWWQMIWTGAAILLQPQMLYKTIPEKIVGADLVWDLARLAEENNFRVYLLGSKGDIAERAAKKLQSKFPKLQIVGASNKNPDDLSTITDIQAAQADMVLVTYKAGSVQEQWLVNNLEKTSASFGIALGGTFDYLAGAKRQPPRFVRKAGLEWLYRLITQPSRVVRIYKGVWGLIIALIRLKVFRDMPYRNNGSAVVVNKENKILLCKRAPYKNVKNHFRQKFENYWQFPQGGLGDNEDPVIGTQRELFEETGIKTVQLLGEAQYNHKYQWNNAGSPLTNRRFRYKGQSQHTVFFRFVGQDDEIQIDLSELTDHQWVPITEVENVIAPERREHARIVLAELAKILV